MDREFEQIKDVLTLDECIDWIARVDACHDAYEFGCGLSYMAVLPDLTLLVKSRIGIRLDAVFNDAWFLMRYSTRDDASTTTLGAHKDGSVRLPDGSRSSATLLIYLNDGFEGGRTCFLKDVPSVRDDPEIIAAVRPAPGLGLLLRQDVWHMAEPVTNANKYVLRTDVRIF